MEKKQEIKLSHRQRVINAIEHKPLDRYPIDLGMHFSTGISAFAYKRLCEYLGIDCTSIEAIDNVQMLARVEQPIIERFHLDTKLLRPRWRDTVSWDVREDYRFNIPRSMNPTLDSEGNWIVANENGRMRMPKGGFFFDGDWLAIRELEQEEYIKETVREAEAIRKDGDYFCTFMELSAYFGGLESACDMYTDPDSVLEQNEVNLRNNIKLMEQLLNESNGYIDGVAINSDLGMQNAPMISPEMYERFCMPFVKRFCEFVHQNSDMKVFLHSCGAIEPLIPHIIHAGVDCLNPVQISANGMDAAKLKERYGKDICFWGGGCNTQHVLSSSTADEVADNVRYLTDIFKKDSGFVFTQVHNIMADVPPENIVAMLDTAYENSFY